MSSIAEIGPPLAETGHFGTLAGGFVPGSPFRARALDEKLRWA